MLSMWPESAQHIMQIAQVGQTDPDSVEHASQKIVSLTALNLFSDLRSVGASRVADVGMSEICRVSSPSALTAPNVLCQGSLGNRRSRPARAALSL